MSKQPTTHSRFPVPGVLLIAAGLVAMSVVGGLLAVALHVNTIADAFGNKAEMAAPWPMSILLIGGGLAAARWRDWRGAAGTVAVAIPCVLALLSVGDDETFKAGMPLAVYAYQVLFLAVSAAVLVPLARHLRSLRRTPRLAPAG